MNKILKQITSSTKNAIPKSLKTIWWLLKIILPISLTVSILQYLGVIAYIAGYLTPVFSVIGLPGESAIVFISSIFLTLYAPIAILTSLALDMREITILALMCLISHNLFVETAVQKKTGSSAIIMFTLRIVTSFVSAFILNLLLPKEIGPNIKIEKAIEFASIFEMLLYWVKGAGYLILKISIIVTGLMILQNILKDFKILDNIARIFSPIMKIMGLSPDSSFLWFIAQIVGLTYGSIVMIDAVNNQDISPKNADLLNYHIAINHSMLEDTLLFVAIGVPAAWIMTPRIILAVLIVWFVKIVLTKKAIHQ